MNSYRREDIDEVLERVGDSAREQAFSKGNPIIYMKYGKMLKEFSDGKIVEIRRELE